jgi:hypothetical protein
MANENATAATVFNQIIGADNNSGQAEPWRLAAMLYTAHMFGLAKDYAFPEGSNVSASLADQVTTLTKLLTRKAKLADGNEYDLFDMMVTNTKWVLSQNPHINDTEINSVNYKKPA